MSARAEPTPLLAGLSPEVFRAGTIVLVEFDPHSLWYEASVTMAARSLAAGLKTDYHTFQHVPDDVVRSLERQGIDVQDAQRGSRFRLLDSYSPRTGVASPDHHPPYEFTSQSLRISEWKKGALAVLKDPGERGLVHIDENDSLLTRYNREHEILDFFQTLAFEAARKREFLFVHALMKGVHSKGFYRQFEYLADATLDFRSREVQGRMEHLVRVRAIRGIAVDSRWRLLSLTAKGEVRALGLARAQEASRDDRAASPEGKPVFRAREAEELPFKNRKAAKVFEMLVEALAEDRDVRQLAEDNAGWRSLVQVSHAAGFSPSSLYPRKGAVNPVRGELASRGLIETRVDPGARGRGGVAMRVRIAQDLESTRRYLRRRGRS